MLWCLDETGHIGQFPYTRGFLTYRDNTGPIGSAGQARGSGIKFAANAPKYLERGEGTWVWDEQGRRFLDWTMGLRSITLGYGCEAVVQAAIDQIRKGSNFGRPSTIETEFARDLVDLIPCAQMVKFAQYGSKLLDSTPEMNTVRRQTPKHEWVMPYHLRRILPEETLDYLLLLGAEVRAKQRGMSYQAREQHSFTPYIVFGAAQPEEGFGDPTGKRPAAGIEFDEYSIALAPARTKALELLELIKAQNPR